MRVLVTGGAGYIGSVVTTQLLEAGHDVTVLDDLSAGHRDAVPEGAAFVEARIHDCLPVLRGAAVAGAGFDAVLHFAAKSLVAESVEQPEIYWENNVGGTIALVAAMRACRVPTLVFSSTAATYGAPETFPITEDMPAVPLNPYGQTKLAMDFLLGSEARAHGLAAVSLRYFNVGGALGRCGERHDPETHLIPNVLSVAAGERQAVEVFGTDYDTSDGTAVRDYLHVEDLGRAHLLALDAVEAGEHRVYNLGTGTGYTVRQVVEACRAVTGHAVPAEVRPRRPGDPPCLVASAERIATDLGWSPKHGLEEIVADAWRFLQDTRD